MSLADSPTRDTSVVEDIYNIRPSGGGGGGITRSVGKVPKRLGHHDPVGDPRLYSYDRLDALTKPPLAWDVTRDDRMSKVEAGETMRDLIKLYGLTGESPVVLDAFHDAMYYTLTVNSGSVLQPGRAKMTIGGTEFDLSRAMKRLDNNLRRFSRAYADEIRKNNERILACSDPTDYVRMEQAEQIRAYAADRGLSRFPYLAHDSADACSGLSDTERAALTASKSMVFGAGVNMADRARARPGIMADASVGSMFDGPSAPVVLGDRK